MAYGATFQSYMPCNGGTAQIASTRLQAVAGNASDIPSIAHLFSQGSGASSMGLILPAGTDDITSYAVLSDADQWGQSGKGYQLNLVRDATEAAERNVQCSSALQVPPQTGFTYAAYVKIGAALVGLTGFFGKVNASFVLDRGFGCRMDVGATNVVAWVGNVATGAQTVSLAASSLVVNEYALIILRYTETNSGAHTGSLKLTIVSSAGTATATTTGVSGATLGLSAASYSPLFTGGIPSSVTPGALTMTGKLVWDIFWQTAASDAVLAAIIADEFYAFEFPKGLVVNFEDPQSLSLVAGAGTPGRTKLSVYIGTSYNKATDDLFIDFPGTPTFTYTRQGWSDSTMGGTSTGTSAVIYQTNEYGGPGWPELCDSTTRPRAVLVVMDYFNGSGNLGNATSPNNSVLFRRWLLALAYFDGITQNPLPTGSPPQITLTGWSAAAGFAVDCGLRRPDKCANVFSVHSSYQQDPGDGSNFHFSLDTLANNNYDWTTPPTGTEGAALSTYSNPATALSAVNGNSHNWKTDTLAKTIRILFLTGTSASDNNNPDTVNGDLALMYAQGYSPALVRHIHLTSGRDGINHSKSRDLVASFAQFGFAPFFPSNTLTGASLRRGRRRGSFVVRSRR